MSIGSGLVTQWGFTDEAEFDNAAGTPTASATSIFQTFEGPIPSVTFGVTQDSSMKHRGYSIADVGDYYSTLTGGLTEISFSDMSPPGRFGCLIIFSYSNSR